jgi:hypothetical protein
MAERSAMERSPGQREAIAELQSKQVGFNRILNYRARTAHLRKERPMETKMVLTLQRHFGICSLHVITERSEES